MLIDNDYIYTFIKNSKICLNLRYLIIQKAIKLCKLFYKYYYILFQLFNLASKKTKNDKFLLNY